MTILAVQPITPRTLADRLLSEFRGLKDCVVAFSGGVDSAVVAKAAHLTLGDRAVAVTGVSDSLAAGEMEVAQRVARQIGIRHEVLATAEITREAYTRNAPDRCFHCKTELYGTLTAYAEANGLRTIANGANADDRSDFRPGTQAATNFQVISPLADCGFTKEDVRSLARVWSLEVWDKPATPCLSSRVAYGVEVTPERLARIDQAEQVLRGLGFSDVRVRCHADDLARIEVADSEVPRLCEAGSRERLLRELSGLGFKFVTIDLEGFRSGSFQQLIPADSLEAYKQSS
ncbi:MAG: ATP-dependent sacrificial sulfur transferase LarE [Planctomycetota bacterium]